MSVMDYLPMQIIEQFKTKRGMSHLKREEVAKETGSYVWHMWQKQMLSAVMRGIKQSLTLQTSMGSDSCT